MKEPDIIETLSYENILSRMKDDLVARDPEFSLLLESDPAIKIMEVAAWRELLLRQRVNDAAQANLLAFARGNDLAHLGAFYDVERMQDESDDKLRTRIREKLAGWSTAGSKAHYRYHALSADNRVKDAKADSPEAGMVRVSVLSTEGNGTASDELLQIVTKCVNADDVRVLTDTVEVVACEIVPVDIVANIYFYNTAQEQIIENIKNSFVQTLGISRGLGWDLTRSWVIAHLFVEGVRKVELVEPLEDIIVGDNACVALREFVVGGL